MCIAANKFAGIRAGVCLTEEMAALSRRHNDANILVLPGRLIGVDEALRIVRAWLETPFEGGRHQRRLDKIAALESRLQTKQDYRTKSAKQPAIEEMIGWQLNGNVLIVAGTIKEFLCGCLPLR
jgi:hypothetical protein